MAKMRGTKPEFWTDEKVVSVSRDARLLFIGMWNFMCDNGHIDDSPIQLKMRVFPADNIDVPPLVDELIAVGLLVRENGYLKAVNLSVHQSIDKRYLSLCDHCAHDENPTFTEADRLLKPQVGKGNTAGARSAHGGRTTGTPSAPATEGEGEGEKKEEPKGSSSGRAPRATKRQVPEDFQPSPKALEWQKANHPNVNTADETERFINHHRAKGSKFADLDAAWRNWIKNAEKFAAEQPRSLRSVAGTQGGKTPAWQIDERWA